MGVKSVLENINEKIKNKNKLKRNRKLSKEIILNAEANYEKSFKILENTILKTNKNISEYNLYKEKIIKNINNQINLLNEKLQYDIATNKYINNVQTIDLLIKFKEEMSIIGLKEKYFKEYNEEDKDGKELISNTRFYKNKLVESRNKLRELKEKITEIDNSIYYEKQTLESLNDKIIKLIKIINQDPKYQRLTIEENIRYRVINKIYGLILKLVEIEFVKENYTINSTYKKTYENIEKVNYNIRSLGSVNEDLYELIESFE